MNLSSHPPLRILCVDDNEDAATSLGMLLDLMGYETEVCFDGRTAFALADGFDPDVCLLDVNMPGMDGCELARRLRARAAARGDHDHPMTLIALTARGADADRRRTAEAGFDRHLVKPVALDELTVALADGARRVGADGLLC